ncbi:MAG TPA: lyase family protein [Vicinamibacterales bacterium]|jgi:aspartate ammonia-lyase
MPPSTSAPTRTEHDLLGTVEVPAEALYGAQTTRALRNFPVDRDRPLGSYPTLVEGLLMIKQATALANRDAGLLDRVRADAIIAAAGSLLEARRFDDFPIHRLHGGGGTSANQNTNEVVANVAEERLGGTRGQYRLVHPNDHVNLHQSTNDVVPTACHIAVVRAFPEAAHAISGLADAFRAKGAALGGIRRIGRTCLMDAVDITFADLFGGYGAFLDRALRRVSDAVDALHAVNLGGTIVGRTCDVPASYFDGIMPALRAVTGDDRYVQAANLFDATQNLDDMVAVSGALDLLARGLVKIAQDLRLMNTGPEAGLGEIRLPAVQPGSTCMPGKVNPVIPEFVIQLALQVAGCHAACQAAVDHGELDLNVWESLVVSNVLDAMALLANASATLQERSIAGLEADAARNERHADTIIPLLTRQKARHSYSVISDIAARAGGDLTKLRKLLKEHDEAAQRQDPDPAS